MCSLSGDSTPPLKAASLREREYYAAVWPNNLHGGRYEGERAIASQEESFISLRGVVMGKNTAACCSLENRLEREKYRKKERIKSVEAAGRKNTSE